MITTVDNIRKIRPISENVNDEKRLIPYIEEAEKLFLIPAIGASLYKQIESEQTTFEALFTGGFYTDEKNNEQYFAGLNDAMGYLTYSRFVRSQNVNATAFGIVTKQGQFSDPVDEKTIVRIANDAEKIGIEYLNQCIAYLKSIGKIDVYKKSIVKRKFKAIG